MLWKAVGYIEEEWMMGWMRGGVYTKGVACVRAYTTQLAMGSVVRSGPELMKADRLCVCVCVVCRSWRPSSPLYFIDTQERNKSRAEAPAPAIYAPYSRPLENFTAPLILI